MGFSWRFRKNCWRGTSVRSHFGYSRPGILNLHDLCLVHASMYWSAISHFVVLLHIFSHFFLKQSTILQNNCSFISLASTYLLVIKMISAVCLTVHARMYSPLLNENYNNSFMEGWQYIARHQNHTSDICNFLSRLEFLLIALMCMLACTSQRK